MGKSKDIKISMKPESIYAIEIYSKYAKQGSCIQDVPLNTLPRLACNLVQKVNPYFICSNFLI